MAHGSRMNEVGDLFSLFILHFIRFLCLCFVDTHLIFLFASLCHFICDHIIILFNSLYIPFVVDF